MERKADLNLSLEIIWTKYGYYEADTNCLIVYCKEECVRGKKVENYDDCYLMSRTEYDLFLHELGEKKHRACFVYTDDWRNRLYLHPCIVIVRIDKASLYSSYYMSEEEHLGQFLTRDETVFREVCMYTLMIEKSGGKEEEEENRKIEILDL